MYNTADLRSDDGGFNIKLIMKVFKFVLWFIVILTMAVSIAFWTVVTFAMLIRLIFFTSEFNGECVLMFTVLPMLLYSLYMWPKKYSRDLINNIKR